MTYEGSDETRILGVIPARMASYRFPGKPLAEINGMPMLAHVVERAAKFERWSALYVATPDEDIATFCVSKGYRYLMTSPNHMRALDRVAETAAWYGAEPNDIIVCVQGDEPMLRPEMIEVVVTTIEYRAVGAAVLAVPIESEKQWRDPDTVKIVKDADGRLIYTSRAAIPHGEGEFNSHLAFRVGGIFAFRWPSLNWFTSQEQGALELAEQCDINRFIDHRHMVRVATIEITEPYISVDRPEDIGRVETALRRGAEL